MSSSWQHTSFSVYRSVASRLTVSCIFTLALLAFASNAVAAPPTKPAALGGHQIVFASSGQPSQDPMQIVLAECPPGKGVIAGGYSFPNAGLDAFNVIDNHPSGEYVVQEPGGDPVVINDGWLITVKRTDGKPENWSVNAYAVCVDTE